MKWITREHPKIDRIACPWLIRRFIDVDAEIIYVPFDQVLIKAKEIGGTPFDLPGVEYTHYDDRCTFDYFLNPLPITNMIHRVFAMGIHEDIDIGQNHAPCSNKASKAAELFKSTPGRTPSPPTVVRCRNGCRATGGFGAILSRSVSSIRCDKSQPFSWASLVAWSSKASSS